LPESVLYEGAFCYEVFTNIEVGWHPRTLSTVFSTGLLKKGRLPDYFGKGALPGAGDL
jgi:hypothetical protein